MIFLAFCVGFICCAFLVLLIVLAIPSRRSIHGYQPLPYTKFPPPPTPTLEKAKKPCWACYGGDLPCVCRRYRDADLYDVGMEAAFPRDVHDGSTQD